MCIRDRPISFSVPTGNFGDVFAGYLAKQMGLPIDKLIVATNENDILHRAISNGDYVSKKVKETLSPSMDIQLASNFERLLFYVVGEDDQRVNLLMDHLSKKGFFKFSTYSPIVFFSPTSQLNSFSM